MRLLKAVGLAFALLGCTAVLMGSIMLPIFLIDGFSLDDEVSLKALICSFGVMLGWVVGGIYFTLPKED